MRPHRPIARVAALCGAIGLVAACAGESADPAGVAAPLEPAALGVLPDSPPPLVAPPTAPAVTATTAFDVPEVERVTEPVGEFVDGNRLLLIGDTSMATLTGRQGGIACLALPDFGWQVRVEAEVGRFVSFAHDVIDEAVVDTGVAWDVYGLMFGLHVDTSAEEFGVALGDVIDRLDDRPVLVYTVAERADPDDDIDEEAAALNRQIRAFSQRPNVVVIDWAEIVDADPDGALVDDDRVPTDEGMSRLTLFTVAALGQYPPLPPPPVTAPGQSTVPPVTVPPAQGACLESTFIDDSAILL